MFQNNNIISRWGVFYLQFQFPLTQFYVIQHSLLQSPYVGVIQWSSISTISTTTKNHREIKIHVHCILSYSIITFKIWQFFVNIFQINIFSLLVSYSKLPLFYINIHTLYHVHVFIFLTFLSRSTHKKRSSSVTPLLVHTWKKKILNRC